MTTFTEAEVRSLIDSLQEDMEYFKDDPCCEQACRWLRCARRVLTAKLECKITLKELDERWAANERKLKLITSV